ncbi:hypothetical protein [Salinirubrum litoreum]|uniref:Uncharacterized protein n=1 Tax=Salinirubrum litoreum TaxID=1126234 RepID=A0ABD5RAD1_9EURY|nr:hypothetical protein [Salinirubrum litoreum]
MALLDSLAGVGYVGFVTFLGLLLAPDPTGIAPLGVVLGGGLVAVHALVRSDAPTQVLLATAGATLGLAILTTVGFAVAGAVIPASALVSALALVGVPPVGYVLVLASGVADREPGETAADDADDATEV